jgi:tetratricopeptide (TPR) repeat protein
LRAVSEMNRNLFGQAEQDIHQAIQAAPQSAIGYVQLGNLKFAQKRYGDAIKAYQDGLNRDPKSVDALRGLTNVYVAEGKIDEAILAANAGIAKSSNNAGFYELLGTLLFQHKKDLSGAEEAFRKSLAAGHQNSDAWIKLAEVQAAQRELDQAIATCEQALREYPEQVSLYVFLGQTYESKRDWKKAEEAYQNVLAIKPEDPVASNNLANVILQEGGNPDVALSLAQTAQRGLPDSPEVADTLGWIYYQKGVYRSAVSLLEESLKLQEKSKLHDNPDVNYHLALAYEKAGQPQLARQQLQRVLKIDPDYSAAASIKKQLAN